MHGATIKLFIHLFMHFHVLNNRSLPPFRASFLTETLYFVYASPWELLVLVVACRSEYLIIFNYTFLLINNSVTTTAILIGE
jgi:hypothetical protein